MTDDRALLERAARSERCCKTCRHLNVGLYADGRRVVVAGRAYQCSAPLPDVSLPECMTKAYGFEWPPRRAFMTGSDGKSCPAWAPIVRAAAAMGG